AEDKAVARQTNLLTGTNIVRNESLGIVNLTAVRQIRNFLRIIFSMVGGHYNRVSDQVINIIYPHRSWKTSVADLQRGSSRRKDVRSAMIRKTITIDSYVNFHISCKLRDINVCVRIYIYKFIESRLEPRL